MSDHLATGFPIDDALRTRMLDAITGGGTVGMAPISVVNIIAPLIIVNGPPALLAVARVLADKVIADLGLRAEHRDTIDVRDPNGVTVTVDNAPHDTARNQVLAYQFVAARLEGDDARQAELIRLLSDGGLGLYVALCAAVRTHHQARALADQRRAAGKP